MGIAPAVVELNGKTEPKEEGEYHEKFAENQKIHEPQNDLVEEVAADEICIFLRRRPRVILLYKMNNTDAEQGETPQYVDDFNTLGFSHCKDDYVG